MLTRRRVRIGAAALAFVLALAAVESWRRGAPEPTIDAAAVPPEPLRLVAPLGDLTDTPQQFEWQPMAGAARYEAVLMEVDRTELWRGTTAASQIALPATVRSKMVEQKTLLWRVISYGPDGERLRESAPGRFRLGPG